MCSLKNILEDKSHSWSHEDERVQRFCRMNSPPVNHTPIRNSAQQWRKERRVMMKNGCMWWMRSICCSPWEQQAWIRFPIPNPSSRPSAGKQENWPQISIYGFFILFLQVFFVLYFCICMCSFLYFIQWLWHFNVHCESGLHQLSLIGVQYWRHCIYKSEANVEVLSASENDPASHLITGSQA